MANVTRHFPAGVESQKSELERRGMAELERALRCLARARGLLEGASRQVIFPSDHERRANRLRQAVSTIEECSAIIDDRLDQLTGRQVATRA